MSEARLIDTDEAIRWPHDVGIEEAVLGVALAKPDLLDALGKVTEDDFFCTWHRAVWYVAETLRAEGRAVSALAVIAELRSYRARGITENLPDEAYNLDLNEIAICAPRWPDQAKAAGDALRNLSQRRALIAALNAGTHDAIDANVGEAPIELAGRVLEAVQHSVPQPDLQVSRADVIARILTRAERPDDDKTLRVYSGITRWDDFVGGMKGGELHIIGARPGMGKTIVGGNVSVNVCEQGKAALFFSMEVGSEQLSQRLICDIAERHGHEIWTNSLRKGGIPKHLIQPLVDASDRLAAMPLFIDERRGISLQDINMAARDLRRKQAKLGIDLGVIVIDYLTLIQPSDRYKGQKVNEVTELSRGLKNLAGDLGVPIVALAQLSRLTEARGNADNRPRLSDLRESGAIEQDADTVSLLFREEYYVQMKEPAEKSGEAYAKWQADMAECRDRLEINLAKNRDGQTGIIECRVKARCSAVRDA